MSIPTLPQYPTRTMQREELVVTTENWMAALGGWTNAANALAANLNAVAVGGAVALPYAFNSALLTTVPAGQITFNSANAGTTTYIYFNRYDANGTLQNTVINSMAMANGGQPSSYLRLYKPGSLTPTLFKISGPIYTSGTDTTRVDAVYLSGPNIANGENIVASFTPCGITGATGPQGGNLINLTGAGIVPTLGSAAVNLLNIFTSGYDNYLIIGSNICPSANDVLLYNFAIGGTLDLSTNYFRHPDMGTANATVASTSASLHANTIYAAGSGVCFKMMITNANAAAIAHKAVHTEAVLQSGSSVYSRSFMPLSYNNTSLAPLTGIGFKWNSAATFKNQGKINVYGFN